MEEKYTLDIQGYVHDLPVLPLPSGVKICFFNLHGNSPLTEHCGKKLAKLADLNDKELWESMLGIAGNHGQRVNATMPPHGEMERIRRILRGEERISLGEAMKLISTYKKKGGK